MASPKMLSFTFIASTLIMEKRAIRKQRDFRGSQEKARVSLKAERFLFAIGSLVVLGCMTNMAPEASFAAQSIPEEGRLGWFFHLTHLPIAVYAILFFIFILSVVNLWFQAWHAVGRVGPYSLWDSLKDLWRGNFEWGFAQRHLANSQQRKSQGRFQGSFRVGSEAVIVTDVVGAPRLSSTSQPLRDHNAIPTPLDGIDHPLPPFASASAGLSNAGENSVLPAEPEKKPVSFKFSSAVDLPAEEESSLRDKLQLVVSGFVTGPNGKALPSVLVYLTDLEGNRVGQSCRTSPETGEYKVLVSEPGKYVLKAHKRGMMMEGSEGISLPMEAGKVEGLNFSMIPDGCVVKGRVVLSETSEPIPDVVIRCQSRLGDYTGETLSDSQGNFSIVGAPPNCECYLEILDPSGNRLHVTNQFETVQKNLVSLTIHLPRRPTEHAPSTSKEPAQTASAVVPSAGAVNESPGG